jgi:peptidoglycan/LPS O-acetylase OafA/YrhL
MGYPYRSFGAFRFLLAICVVAQHFLGNLAPEPLASNSLPFEFGTVAVSVFFALSGFVIGEAADRMYRERPVAFFANRLLRIMPHFLMAVSISMLLCMLFYDAGALRLGRGIEFDANIAFSTKNILLNLLGFMPGAGLFIPHNFLIPAWAIQVEMLFYIVMMGAIALSMALGRRLGRHISVSAIGAVVAVSMAPLFLLSSLGRTFAAFQFMPYFVYGAALYIIVVRRQKAAFIVAAIALTGILFQFFSQPVRHSQFDFDRAVTAEFVALILLLSLMSVLAFVRVDRLKKADQFLGDMTYPLYMWHPDVLVLVLSITVGYSYFGLICGLLASLIVSFAAHRLIDPAVDRIRDAVRGRRIERKLSAGLMPPGLKQESRGRQSA